jgi:ribonuclease VapC
VDADREIALGAAEIKAGHALSFAGCFAVALARRLGAAVVTGDPEFEKVGELAPIFWL